LAARSPEKNGSRKPLPIGLAQSYIQNAELFGSFSSMGEHSCSQEEWSQRFVSEMLRLWPRVRNADTLAKKLWTLKGVHGMGPEEAAQRFNSGEFVFLRH
jgi:hypothetical protein